MKPSACSRGINCGRFGTGSDGGSVDGVIGAESAWCVVESSISSSLSPPWLSVGQDSSSDSSLLSVSGLAGFEEEKNGDFPLFKNEGSMETVIASSDALTDKEPSLTREGKDKEGSEGPVTGDGKQGCVGMVGQTSTEVEVTDVETEGEHGRGNTIE